MRDSFFVWSGPPYSIFSIRIWFVSCSTISEPLQIFLYLVWNVFFSSLLRIYSSSESVTSMLHGHPPMHRLHKLCIFDHYFKCHGDEMSLYTKLNHKAASINELQFSQAVWISLQASKRNLFVDSPWACLIQNWNPRCVFKLARSGTKILQAFTFVLSF